jgi:hypothetical protein
MAGLIWARRNTTLSLPRWWPYYADARSMRHQDLSRTPVLHEVSPDLPVAAPVRHNHKQPKCLSSATTATPVRAASPPLRRHHPHKENKKKVIHGIESNCSSNDSNKQFTCSKSAPWGSALSSLSYFDTYEGARSVT